MEGEGRPEIRHNHPVVAAHENSQVVISGQKTSDQTDSLLNPQLQARVWGSLI